MKETLKILLILNAGIVTISEIFALIGYWLHINKMFQLGLAIGLQMLVFELAFGLLFLRERIGGN